MVRLPVRSTTLRPTNPAGYQRGCDRSQPRPSTSLLKSLSGTTHAHAVFVGNRGRRASLPRVGDVFVLKKAGTERRQPIYRRPSGGPQYDFRIKKQILRPRPITPSASSHDPSILPNRATIATVCASRPITLEPQVIAMATFAPRNLRPVLFRSQRWADANDAADSRRKKASRRNSNPSNGLTLMTQMTLQNSLVCKLFVLDVHAITV